MFRSKEVKYECTDYVSAVNFLKEENTQAINAALQYLARTLIQGVVPPSPCIDALVEIALPSEDESIRERGYRILRYVYEYGKHLHCWADVRHAIIAEINNAESARAMRAAFDLLDALPIHQKVVFCCSTSSSSALKESILIKECSMRAVSVQHTPSLLLSAWDHVSKSANGTDALLFETQTIENREKQELTSEEPRRVRENLADLLKEVFCSCAEGVLDKATVVDTATGKLETLESSPELSVLYSRCLLDLLRRQNIASAGASVHNWALALLAVAEADGHWTINSPYDVRVAQASSARWRSVAQVVIHIIVENIQVLVAKACFARKTSELSVLAALLSEVFSLVLHEIQTRTRASLSDLEAPASNDNSSKFLTTSPTFTLTAQGKATSMFDNEGGNVDETAMSRMKTNKQMITPLIVEWVTIHLMQELVDGFNPLSQTQSSSTYTFARYTRQAGWDAARLMLEFLQESPLNDERANISTQMAPLLLKMLEVEATHCVRDRSWLRHNHTSILYSCAMLVRTLSFVSVDCLLVITPKVIELLSRLHMHFSDSAARMGQSYCRLLATLHTVFLQRMPDGKGSSAYFSNTTVQTILSLPSDRNIASNHAKFSVYFCVSACRSMELALHEATSTPVNDTNVADDEQITFNLSLLQGKKTIELVNYCLNAVEKLLPCLTWSLFSGCGEGAQLALSLVLCELIEALLPVNNVTPLRILLESRELKSQAYSSAKALLHLIDRILDDFSVLSTKTETMTAPILTFRSTLLEKLGANLVELAKLSLGIGYWNGEIDETPGSLNSLADEESSTNLHTANSPQEGWTESSVHPLQAEVYTRGLELIRILEQDIHDANGVLTTNFMKSVDCIAAIASAFHEIDEDPKICIDVLKAALRRARGIDDRFSDWIYSRLQGVLTQTEEGLGDEVTLGTAWSTPSAVSSLRSHSPHPNFRRRHMNSTINALQAHASTTKIRERSLFASVNTNDVDGDVVADAAAEVLAAVDGVCNMLPIDLSHAETSAEEETCTPALLFDDVVFTQISGSADALTVLAAVDVDRVTRVGVARVRVINSTGFKFEGYSIQVYLRSANKFEVLRSLSRYSKTNSAKLRTEALAPTSGDAFSLMPDEYAALSRGIVQESRECALPSTASIASFFAGAPQRSPCTEYVAVNGTSESMFEFQLHEFGAVEIVVRLSFQDLQDDDPNTDLWSLVNTAVSLNKSAPENIRNLQTGVDEFSFTADRGISSSSSQLQCQPLRLPVAAQLSPYGYGALGRYRGTASSSRVINGQILSPSSACIPHNVFASVWNRCSENASIAVPLVASCLINGNHPASIGCILNKTIISLQNGSAGGCKYGSHYIGAASRVLLDPPGAQSAVDEESFAWAFHTAWGGELAVFINVFYEDISNETDSSMETLNASRVDPLSSEMTVSSVHAAELAALLSAAASTRGYLKDNYRAGIECRASDPYTLNAALEDIDGLVSALTGGCLAVNQAEYEEKFFDSRGNVPSKLNATRVPNNSSFSPRQKKIAVFQADNRPFGVY